MKKQILKGLATGFCILFAISAIANKKVVYNLASESDTIDPQLVTGTTGIQVDAAIMEGLTKFGEKQGEIVPGVAEKWDVTEDGMKWTFYLRKDAKWSNGEPVTAHDFWYGMKRGLEPATGAKYGYLLWYIKNGEKYTNEEIKDFSQVGIKVIDDYTLEIVLGTPCTFFDQLMGFPTSFPVNQKFYEKIEGDDNYFLDKDYILYNGPWIINEWIPGEGGKIDFKKNPYYWNKENIEIENLEFVLVPDFNTASNMYKTGAIDVTQITVDQLALFKGKKDLHYINAGGVWYLEFCVHNKYFANKKIRQAFAMAVNRDILCDEIKQDGSKPAYAFIPPGTKGPNGKGFEATYDRNFFEMDIEKAKKLLAEGLKEIGETGPITVKLLYNPSGPNQKNSVFIQQELYKNLGVDVVLEPATFSVRLQKMAQHDFDFYLGGWGPDYDDPMTYMDMYLSGGGNNHPDWRNEDYDKLIELAQNSSDDKERMEHLYKAEQLLMEEMPVAPLWFTYRMYIVKPELKDVVFRMTGPAVDFYWAHVNN